MRKTMNLKGFLLILGAMAALFLAAHWLLQNNLSRKTEQENALRVALTRLEEQNTSLIAKLNVVGTEDYIVSSAMENYSYVNRDDIRFEYENPEALYAYTEDEIRVLMDEMID